MAATILLALAPIFFILAVGYGAGRLHVVDNRNVDSLNVLVMTFALPAALFGRLRRLPAANCWNKFPCS
jgi:malonate transporter and related proteins